MAARIDSSGISPAPTRARRASICAIALPGPDSASPVDEPAPPAAGCAYAAKALHGVWAAAPYLHNGSVRSLRQLLEPAESRDAAFAVGPVYDMEEAGLSTEQPDGAFVLETTGCDDIASGDSRCGHEFGVTLEPAEKDALIAYLKRL